MTQVQRHDWQWAPVEYVVNAGTPRSGNEWNNSGQRKYVNGSTRMNSNVITRPAKVECRRCGISVPFERFNRDHAIRRKECIMRCTGADADA